jgi:hypothetical protein
MALAQTLSKAPASSDMAMPFIEPRRALAGAHRMIWKWQPLRPQKDHAHQVNSGRDRFNLKQYRALVNYGSIRATVSRRGT